MQLDTDGRPRSSVSDLSRPQKAVASTESVVNKPTRPVLKLDMDAVRDTQANINDYI